MSFDIVIVDDESDICTLLAGILKDEGYEARTASNGEEALHLIKIRQPNLVILDVWLGNAERDGIKILEIIKKNHPYVPVLMISGHSTIETAVAAIKLGAYDFIEKPFQTDKLLILIQRAIELSNLKRENDLLLKSSGFDEIVGQSNYMNQIKHMIEKLGQNNSRIFISGPNGVGKAMIARLVHKQSPRKNGPFITFNCANVSPDLIDVELFGTHIQGALSKLYESNKIGVVEQAHKGTLFLEEIGDLPLSTQGKLLRLLQENSFMKVGGNERIPLDIRLICSSAASIEQKIHDGYFRQDLFYRINVSNIFIPPLKQRSSDIKNLCEHFIQVFSANQGEPERKLSEEALAILEAYDWPGNVRQLKNVMEWTLIMNPFKDKNNTIDVGMLPPEVRVKSQVFNHGSTNIISLPLREAREAFEKQYLVAQINRFGGNISQTARFVGMERSALHRKLKALGAYDSKGDIQFEEDHNSAPINGAEIDHSKAG